MIEGVKESSLTKHLVVDEMQDYTPVQYAALNRMFPCQKTILGDFGQFINPNHLHSLADLQELYKEAEFVELNKSYRSTYEIISFAKRIQEVAALEPVERHGEQPELIACQDTVEEIRVIKEAIQKFRKEMCIRDRPAALQRRPPYAFGSKTDYRTFPPDKGASGLYRPSDSR